MDQQTWIVTFHNDSVIEASQHARELKELFLDISRESKVTFLRNTNNTQSGIEETIIALLPSTVLIAAINAIKQFFLRNHPNNASIDLEIKELKFKAAGISQANYMHTMEELLKYVQTLENEEK